VEIQIRADSSNRLRRSVDDFYCAKFQVILITGFGFIVLTYTPAYPQT